MSQHIKIKRGLDIRLKGEPEKKIIPFAMAEIYAIQPPDFTGVVPKLLVKEGDEVKSGTPLFFDKENIEVMFVAPVSGEIAAIERGAKRKILAIKILADKEIRYEGFDKTDPAKLTPADLIKHMLATGVWPFIRQRPFGTIADPAKQPKAIFISCFDSAPLAPDYNFMMPGNEENFQTGLDVLKQLTTGKVHLNLRADGTNVETFTNARGITINEFSGPHPSGNVGVQIHHINPLNKGEVIWYVQPQDVTIIGRLFSEGRYNAEKMIALTGSRLTHPQYCKTIIGSPVKHMLQEAGMQPGDNRIISGNILSGRSIADDGFLDFYDSQLTVIPEGDQPEFMGWLMPGLSKFSTSRTFFSWLTPSKKYNLDTNMHGEERPFVITGEYEKVLPMDIYPVQLLKSILVEDIDLMEKLGIYEVVEEDFALCEFVCTSKVRSQSIIRKGLSIIRKEFS